MRINIIINDETIERDVKQAVSNLENDEEIYFTFESEKTEFIEMCVEEVISNYETRCDYSPNYENLVLEMYNENDY